MKPPKAWLKHIGRKGGSANTPAQAAARAANGKKGGRPKKSAQPASEPTT